MTVSKKEIIITGGAGFIGFHLAKSLVKLNYKVTIWDDLSRGKLDNELKQLLKNKNINFLKINLKNKINIKKLNISHIFHLAGSVGVENIKKNLFSSFLNNISSLVNVINFANNQGKTIKLILFSTSEVYSNLIKNNLIKFPIKEGNSILVENQIIDRTTAIENAMKEATRIPFKTLKCCHAIMDISLRVVVCGSVRLTRSRNA